ncbi:MAG TPA: lipoyl synthase, partial [Gammaproteobacteria bacterium]
VLTPDFRGCQQLALENMRAAIGTGGELVWGHNVETVPSLYKTGRKGAKYERSLRLLELAAAETNMEAKSSLMLGLGERFDEVIAVMRDLRAVGVERLALGQYLRPTRYHLPVKEYVTPERFAEYETAAQELGFSWVKAGAMVRSSYHAEE